ncbi:MAG: LapA family protein [Verrucomicrobiota bacterium]|jgi:cobalamin synthase
MFDHNNPAAGIGIVLLICALIGALIGLVVMIFYILTLQKALNKCAPENRAMEPAMTWLMLIPCFSLIWHFFVVFRVAKTLGAEFQKRGIAEETEPGKTLGLVMCILGCCACVPFVNYLCGPAALVCWIVYWVKIAGFSQKLGA